MDSAFRREEKIWRTRQTLGEDTDKRSRTKLKADDLKENIVSLADAQWESDKQITECRQCQKPFSVGRRKHNCRNCGMIFCGDCSENTMPLPSSTKPVRVCDECYGLLLNRCGLLLFQHHCRNCGMIFSRDCSENTMSLPSSAKPVQVCDECYGLILFQHHCRNCGMIFCGDCSENTMPLPSSAKPVRVCDECYGLLLNRYSAKTATLLE